jgi:hypothetical protein
VFCCQLQKFSRQGHFYRTDFRRNFLKIRQCVRILSGYIDRQTHGTCDVTKPSVLQSTTNRVAYSPKPNTCFCYLSISGSTHTHIHTHSGNSHTLTHTHTHSNTLTLTQTRSLSLSLSHTHTHTHTHISMNSYRRRGEERNNF